MIIVIDDDSFIRELCRMLLKKHRKELFIHQSAEDFFEQKWTPGKGQSIFLIDEQLPGMSGLQLASKLREQFQQKEIKLIAMTGEPVSEKIKNSKEFYFDDYLLKPFSEQSLLSIVSAKDQVRKETVNALHSVNRDMPDLSILYKMADYDSEQVQLFIDQFIADSEDDKSILLNAVENNDMGKVVDTNHKMAGRCGQIGAHALGSAFRRLELKLRKGAVSLRQMKEDICTIVRKLDTTLEFYANVNREKIN